jgi:hypothetical protein
LGRAPAQRLGADRLQMSFALKLIAIVTDKAQSAAIETSTFIGTLL